MKTIETPLGPCHIAASDDGIERVDLRPTALTDGASHTVGGKRHLDAAVEALDQYFAGERRDFSDLTLAPKGTEFQLRVWRALQEIPFGQTESYGGLAARIGSGGGARAVGMANNRNPIWVIVPCHRVIGADGKLVGYGGGIDAKQWLLEHEGARTASLFSAGRASGSAVG